MRIRVGLSVFFLAGALLLASRTTHAQFYRPGPGHEQPSMAQPRTPGAAWGAAVINIAYCPVRLGVTVAGAGLSGLVGWLDGGDRTAADEVWNLFRGPAYVTPAMLQGREPFRFGPWETTPH